MYHECCLLFSEGEYPSRIIISSRSDREPKEIEKDEKEISKPINTNIRVTHINTQHSHSASLALAINLKQIYVLWPQNPAYCQIMEPLCHKNGKLIDASEIYICFAHSYNTPLQHIKPLYILWTKI